MARVMSTPFNTFLARRVGDELKVPPSFALSLVSLCPFLYMKVEDWYGRADYALLPRLR